MNTLYIVDLEAVDTRYTAEWKTHLPEILSRELINHYEVKIISGGDVPQATTPGAFLNFAGTNSYKSQQMLKIADLFADGTVKSGDYFLYTDAWNPTVIQLRYMSELLGIPVKIGGLWHAGSYDPQDFLGRLIGDAAWVRHAEKSMFEIFDHNYFASDFHINMFMENLLKVDPRIGRMQYMISNKIVRTGWPMQYLRSLMSKYDQTKKKNTVLFPHRLAPEKQLEIFQDLAQYCPSAEFIVCQTQTLTKSQYHQLLAESKIVFSANLQETLGISCYEATVLGAVPLVPNRLSYEEMYHDIFKYPSKWTKDWQSYQQHKHQLAELINQILDNFENYKSAIREQEIFLSGQYFSSECMIDILKLQHVSETV